MASIIVVGTLSLSSPSARDRVLAEINTVSEYSRQNEHGVLKHSATVLRDDPTSTLLYVFEEYQNQAAFDAHLACPPVKRLLDWFESNPSLFAKQTVVLTLQPGCGMTRPSIVEKKDPFIVLTKTEFKDNREAELSFLRWKELRGSVERDEPGTLLYYVCADKSDKTKVYSVEAYESEGSWAINHEKAANVIANKGIDAVEGRTRLEVLALRKAGGYLAREHKHKAVL